MDKEIIEYCIPIQSQKANRRWNYEFQGLSKRSIKR